MADVVEHNDAGIPKNRKREFRNQLAIGYSDDVYILLDPSKNTKIQVIKNSEEVNIQSSSDSKLLAGGRITEDNVDTEASILFTDVADNTLTDDFHGADSGITILKISPTGTPGASVMDYNVTQDDS